MGGMGDPGGMGCMGGVGKWKVGVYGHRVGS